MWSKKIRSFLLIVTCLAGLVLITMPEIGYADPPASDASEPASKEWGIAVTPYLWLTGFDFTANGLGLERSVSDVVSMANGVFMFNAGLRWRWLYTAVDGIFVDFGNSSQIGDRLDLYAGLKLEMFTLKAGVKVLDTTTRQEGSGWLLIANAGARYWDMEPTVSYTYYPVPPGMEEETGSGSLSEQWWDPILGAAGLWRASRTVQFEFSGHVGGFGIGDSSTFTWDINGFASFIVWRHIALHAGYRVLETDRTTGEGDSEINTKLHMNGLIVGASFFY